MTTMKLLQPLLAYVRGKKNEPLPVLITDIDEQGGARGYRKGDAAKFAQGTWLVDVAADDGEPTWSELLGKR